MVRAKRLRESDAPTGSTKRQKNELEITAEKLSQTQHDPHGQAVLMAGFAHDHPDPAHRQLLLDEMRGLFVEPADLLAQLRDGPQPPLR